MPVERKPVFSEKVLRAHLATAQIDTPKDRHLQYLQNWAELIKTRQIFRSKETALFPDFVSQIFDGLLGYRGEVSSGDAYTRTREKFTGASRGFVDLALGWFSKEPGGVNRAVVAVEGKGPKDPLDVTFGSRDKSAVDQAYNYAIDLRCEWIMVTNLLEVRLYRKGADKLTYEQFDVLRLAREPDYLRRFLFLLHADRMTQPGGGCHLDPLLEESERADLDLTHEFYECYSALRFG